MPEPTAIGNRSRVILFEFAVHHRVFGPTHKLLKRDVMLQIRSDLLGYGSLGDRHEHPTPYRRVPVCSDRKAIAPQP